MSVAAYFFIVNYTDTTKFIAEDKTNLAQARPKGGSDAERHETFNWVNVRLNRWLCEFAFHTMFLPLYKNQFIESSDQCIHSL